MYMLADVLVPNWVLRKPAVLYPTVTSPLTPINLNEASGTSGSTARAAGNARALLSRSMTSQYS